MGKYDRKNGKRKSSKKNTRTVLIAAIAAVLVLTVLAAALIWWLDQGKTPGSAVGSEPTQASTIPGDSEPTVPGQIAIPTVPDLPEDPAASSDPTQPEEDQKYIRVDFANGEVLNLGRGLQIAGIGSYAGIYMEDGSEEILSDVLMITLKNTAAEDLQLARIMLQYSDSVAKFEATNIPAGATVVLLEKERLPGTDGGLLSAELINVAFFAEPMNLLEDRLEITGENGVLSVKNISDTDITGDIFVYYKHCAQDTFYGGITYRARVSGGLGAGKSQSIMAGHYDPVNCRIVAVTAGE